MPTITSMNVRIQQHAEDVQDAVALFTIEPAHRIMHHVCTDESS